MVEVRHLPPRRHVFIINRFLFVQDDAKFDEFVTEYVTRWRDVNKLIAALAKRFQKKKYPSTSENEQHSES